MTLPGSWAEKFVQQFAEMGIFTCIFSCDIDTLKHYTLSTLGKLLDYDKANNAQLMDTLRHLLDNNINWKRTADYLCIHVNTLGLSGEKDRGVTAY